MPHVSVARFLIACAALLSAAASPLSFAPDNGAQWGLRFTFTLLYPKR